MPLIFIPTRTLMVILPAVTADIGERAIAGLEQAELRYEQLKDPFGLAFWPLFWASWCLLASITPSVARAPAVLAAQPGPHPPPCWWGIHKPPALSMRSAQWAACAPMNPS